MFFLAVILAMMCLAGCEAAPPAGPAPRAAYDAFSGRLIQLSVDQNGDGRLDQWTYLDGNRPLRGEADSDGDGRIDRWEYFDANANLTRVGTSSAGDGVEDTWTWVVGAERLIERSRRRDRRVDRREFYDGTTLVRAEEDNNGDGRLDRWDTYQGGVMRVAAFDTTSAADRPNRRILFAADGRFERVESDDDGDGVFVTVAGATANDLVGAKPK